MAGGASPLACELVFRALYAPRVPNGGVDLETSNLDRSERKNPAHAPGRRDGIEAFDEPLRASLFEAVAEATELTRVRCSMDPPPIGVLLTAWLTI